MKKIDFIDALRGYAILGVIMVHCSQSGEIFSSSIGNLIALKGQRGVQLFFMVSAMTLFYSYNKSKQHSFDVRAFFIRRYFRIAPMFYIGIIYYFFQRAVFEGTLAFDVSYLPALIAALTFTLSLHPYWVSAIVPGGWSVSVEFLFYFMLPVLFYKIKNIQQAINLFLLALIFRFLILQIFQHYPLIDDPDYWSSFLIYFLPNQFPVFVIGIILYFLVFEKNQLSFSNQYSWLLIILIVMLQATTGYDLFISENISFSLMLAAFILYLSYFQHSLLINKIINYIGTVSFSIYIIHFAIIFWLNHLHLLDFFDNTYINFLSKFLLVTGLSLLIASLTYKYIEVPFQKIGASIIARKQFKKLI